MLRWTEVISDLLQLPPREKLVVDKGDLPPLPPSAQVALGSHILNQQWEIPLQNGGRVHVVDCGDHYELHWDEVSPLENPLSHLRRDAPELYNLLLMVLGMLRRIL